MRLKKNIFRRSFVAGIVIFLSSTSFAHRTLAANTHEENIQIFPADNPWNTDISKYPVHPNSRNYIRSIGWETSIHPDFGAGGGIPYVFVDKNQPKVDVRFEYKDESDPGPYPIPDNAPIEGGAGSTGDRHVIVIDKDARRLYELFAANKEADGWKAGSGALWDLSSNNLRPKHWTSTDAAGLPVFPGLVRYDEAAKGKIPHALRFTVRKTQKGFISPARHFASRSSDPNLPPMGLRLRLRADFDTSKFSSTNRAILEALKKYGMILADNGSDWFITGAPDNRWSNDDLHWLKTVKGKDFEVVYTGEIEK